MHSPKKASEIIVGVKVLITLSKTAVGRIELSYVRSTNEHGGIGTGSALPPSNPNALAEVEDILRNLGVSDEVASEKILQLRKAGPKELVKVADLDVSLDLLRENGFAV